MHAFFYYTFWPTSYPEHIGVFYSPSETNVQEKRLTQRKQDLAIAYLQTGNATAAYFVAYPNFTGTRETAASNACRVLKEPLVQEFLEKLRAKAAKPTIATMQEVGEFYTTIMRDKKQFVGDRLSAARGVMLYAKQTQVFDNKQAEPTERAEQTQVSGSFADFCEQAGYFRPFPKQTEMAEFVRQSGARLLLGARGYGKTDYGVICGVAWALLHNPEDTFLIVTKEKQRGQDILGEIARILQEQGKELEKNNSNLITLAGHKGKDPNVAVLPLRSKSFRGRHPKHIICDDIITPDDVSAAERAKVEAVLAELMKLTQNVILIGQPAHAKDVYAKMRRLAGVQKIELPYGSIPQLDHDLEAQRAAGISEASIQASYFLQISESERMPFANLGSVNFFPSGGCSGFVDPSHEGTDYTAFAVGAMNFDQFVVAGFAWQKAWDDCLEDIAEVMRAYNVAKFAFETNGLGKHPVLLLRQMGAKVAEWKSTTNKHGRIMNAATFRDHIKLADFLPPQLQKPSFRTAQKAFNDMVIGYEYKAEHDDAPDALANLLMYLGMVKK